MIRKPKAAKDASCAAAVAEVAKGTKAKAMPKRERMAVRIIEEQMRELRPSQQVDHHWCQEKPKLQPIIIQSNNHDSRMLNVTTATIQGQMMKILSGVVATT